MNMIKTLLVALGAGALAMGCSESAQLNVGNHEVVGSIPDSAEIDRYLANELFPAEFGSDINVETAQCDHELLTAKQGLNNRIYVVANCTGSYVDRPDSESSGFSANPFVLELDPDDTTSITDYQSAKDGSGYSDSIKELFPKSVWENSIYS